MSVNIRPYTSQDTDAVLNLLKLNIPKYFAEEEFKDLEDYLENEVEDYFVLEKNGQLVGAGGINYFLDEKLARLSWDFIHPDIQGGGLGSAIAKFRIEKIRENPDIEKIVVRTSQLAFGFYEKVGFELKRKEPDYWAPGLDLYYMEMKG